MAPPTDDPDAGEAEALNTLLHSDGWKLFEALVESEWGAAGTLEKIENALDKVPRGDHAAVQDTVQQIQASRRAVNRAVGLPFSRLRQIAAPKLPEHQFADVRRITR